jgi:replication factor C large subunit
MSELLTDKYFPKTLEEFIGNIEMVENTLKWAKAWQNGEEQKPLLFVGPTGIGKTALAYLIAKEMGWQIFEMNSSDLRNKDTIEKVAGAATGNASLFGSKRLILIDEVDSLQAADRGGAGAIASVIKTAKNPIILTANDIYANKKLVALRSITIISDFKKINYLSIAKRLRAICDIENITYDPDAVKALAKNSGGDFRGALLDIQSLAPSINLDGVSQLGQRQRKEKIFPVMTKIFKGHDLAGIQQVVYKSEVSSDLLMRWVEENIPRQFDEEDGAKAFSYLSRGDIFQGRIYRRQHYSFLKYVYFLSTVGVGLARTKDYSGWKPFQFPSLLSSLSASTSKRALRKLVAKKIGVKTHLSIKQGMRDIPYIQMLLENKELAPGLIDYFEFDEKEIAFLLNTKSTTKKVQNLLKESSAIEEKRVIDKIHSTQTTLFG